MGLGEIALRTDIARGGERFSRRGVLLSSALVIACAATGALLANHFLSPGLESIPWIAISAIDGGLIGGWAAIEIAGRIN